MVGNVLKLGEVDEHIENAQRLKSIASVCLEEI